MENVSDSSTSLVNSKEKGDEQFFDDGNWWSYVTNFFKSNETQKSWQFSHLYKSIFVLKV